MLKRLFIFSVMLLATLGLSAQGTKTISGTVTEASTGETLIGVTVLEPGTPNGTTTDLDGRYTLNVKGNKVVFSYIGYKSQEVTVTDSRELNIKMASDTELDEVVVVGYGTQRKSDLTGAISSISGKDIKNYAVSNASELLVGKASGVFVAASSGQPGSNAIVRVRGLGTVNDPNPLYVVDGQFMDNINSLNPSDIERMEVLKDASALAIYGSRGSNGVIIITTKGGVKGETVVTFDASVGAKNSYKAMKMMNSDQYYDFINIAYAGDASFQNSMKEKFTNQYKKGYNTNWWDEVTRTGFNQNYNLSIRKGTEDSRTSMSLGYLGDEGTIITTMFNRISLRLNQEYDIKDVVTIGTTINLAKIKKRDSDAMPAFNFIQKADPFTPVISPLVDPSSENYKYNKYAPTEWSYDPNPVAMLELPNRYNDLLNVFGNVFANVKLAKGLTYRAQYSFERNHDTSKDFRPIYNSTFSDDNLANTESKYNKDTKLGMNSYTVLNQSIENRINYNTKFGAHLVDAMVAMTYEKNKSENIFGYKTRALGNENIYQILDAQTTGAQASGKKESNSMLSYLGRINYNYADKYMATVNFRADGSSRFAKNNRWGYFPSFSLGWRITNEEFFQNLNTENWLTNLKLRAGWGRNGNQRIKDNAPLTLIGTNKDSQWNFGNGFSQGYFPSYVGNKNVKWETSQQTNVGLDMTLLGNKLDISTDFYVKQTKDMLLEMPIPSIGGTPNYPFFNAGDLKNTGFEFTFNYRDKIGSDFNYSVGANISTYKTKVTHLITEYLTGAVSRTTVGGPIGRFWGYKQIGIFQNQSEIDNYVDQNGTRIQPNAKPGDFKFAKLSGDGELNDDEDRTFIGDPNPDLIYGFNLGFSYKNFDLTMAFQGTIGNDIWNVAKGGLATAGRQNALAEAYTKAWKQEGDKAKYPRITNSDSNNNYRASSFYVEDGSYLRLQNIQLGYTLPRALCERSKVFSSLRVFVTAQNLFTITSYSGLDPELGINNPLDTGVDNTRYPSARTYTFGVNLQF